MSNSRVYLLNKNTCEAYSGNPSACARFIWGRDSEDWLLVVEGKVVETVFKFNPSAEIGELEKKLTEELRGTRSDPLPDESLS